MNWERCGSGCVPAFAWEITAPPPLQKKNPSLQPGSVPRLKSQISWIWNTVQPLRYDTVCITISKIKTSLQVQIWMFNMLSVQKTLVFVQNIHFTSTVVTSVLRRRFTVLLQRTLMSTPWYHINARYPLAACKLQG